jgi:hypothetical protein
MGRNYWVLAGMVLLIVAAFAAFAVYRWVSQARERRVKAWITRYLSKRYGALPGRLTIYCPDDLTRPVLAGFDNPASGIRHHCQFACSGRPAGFALLSETDEPRPG